MPRAAPGDIARGALRRKLPENLRVSVRNSDGCLARYPYPYRFGMETYLHLSESRSRKCCYFTLHLSGFWVERGRLGEVVSLVRDCRPPPPGNPYRPTASSFATKWDGGKHRNPTQVDNGFCFILKKQENGGVFLPLRMYSTFNSHQISANLKDLNHCEYFKNNCSYFSCIVKNPVLKFEHFHSHLCGYRDVEPPSIAITNVLET
jgi:hypothetical protein